MVLAPLVTFVTPPANFERSQFSAVLCRPSEWPQPCVAPAHHAWYTLAEAEQPFEAPATYNASVRLVPPARRVSIVPHPTRVPPPPEEDRIPHRGPSHSNCFDPVCNHHRTLWENKSFPPPLSGRSHPGAHHIRITITTGLLY